MKSRRSLVIVQVPPYPPTGGVALRNWQTLNLLKAQGEVAIFSLYKGEDESSETLIQRGFQLVHYNLASPHRPRLEKVKNRLGWLRPDGYPYADWLYTAAAATALEQQLEQFQPNTIVFEELWLYPYLPVVNAYARTSGCAIVLDNHNVEGSKEEYRSQSWPQRRRLHQIRHIEQKFVQKVHQVWVCSAIDAQQVQQLYLDRKQDEGKVKVVPNGVQADFYRTPVPQPREPHTVLFLGKFSYQPNEEAALILIQEIYPKLQQRYPDSHLWLVGRDPTATMVAAVQGQDTIHITDMVPDVRPYLAAASVMVVPLQQGGGTRLKILEAFAAQCPVVSTPKGAEGLGTDDGHHLYIGETPGELIKQVEHLWQHPALAQHMAEEAHGLFIAQYSWKAVAKAVTNAMAALPHP